MLRMASSRMDSSFCPAAAMVVSIAATSPSQPWSLASLSRSPRLTDLLQPRHLSWVDPEERASDTGVFVRTRGAVVAAAHPEGDLPELEMGQEFVPFARGQVAVFFAGPLGPAAGDECPVVGDHVFGVDRGIAHGGVEHGVPADFRGDVRWHPGPQGVGHEDSPEVMGPPFQRLTGDGDLRGLGGRDHAFADVAAVDGRSSEPYRRWNRNGIGALQVCSNTS